MTFDLGVIGAGPGGYVAAIRASQLGLKVAVIEKEPTLGGTCLNVGCIPSKALLYSSEHFYKWKEEGASLGIITNNLSYDLDVMMRRKEKVVKGFVDGIAFLFRKNKIQRFQGVGKLISPNKVSVNGEVIECKNILLATGSEPIALPFLPFDEESIVTSTGALSLKKVPKKMVVVGAGVVGLELGSVYARLGAEVTFIELMEKVCPTFDETISDRLLKIFTKQKMAFHLSSKVVGGKKEGGGVILKIESKDKNTFDIAADVVLVAIGRRPYIENLGVEDVGIAKENGRIKVDGNFRTNIASIFAIGDLVDGPMLAHKASEEGFSVSDFISGKITSVNYLAIPSVMYTSPEVAFVGLTEKEARAAGFEVNIGNFPFTANSRANTSEGADGLVKIIGDVKTDVCLGLHIICPAASEIIGEGVMIMRKKMTLKEIGESSHAHPTYSEAIKEAALMAKGQVIHM